MITRDNIDDLLDRGQIAVAIRSGRWWRIRRNGATKKWKRDASRIRIPFKYGFYGYGAITETDFMADGTLDPSYYRKTGDDENGPDNSSDISAR